MTGLKFLSGTAIRVGKNSQGIKFPGCYIRCSSCYDPHIRGIICPGVIDFGNFLVGEVPPKLPVGFFEIGSSD